MNVRVTKCVVKPARKQPTAWGTYHPWQYKGRGKGLCSHCSRRRDLPDQRYCRRCRAAYKRAARA